MRSKTYMSKINLQSGILTVENRRSREKKTNMLRSIGKQSGESVESVHLSSFIQNQKCENDAVHQHSSLTFSQSRSCRQTSDATCSGNNSGNVEISDVSDVKAVIILIKFLTDQNTINRIIFLSIDRLINRYFSQPYWIFKLINIREPFVYNRDPMPFMAPRLD